MEGDVVGVGKGTGAGTVEHDVGAGFVDGELDVVRGLATHSGVVEHLADEVADEPDAGSVSLEVELEVESSNGECRP